MKTTLNPFENAKRTANGTGGASPSVIEEIQAEITVLGSQNETQAQDITDIKGSLKSINDNLTDGIGGTTDKFRFGTDGKGNYGYIKKVAGADTFFPFSTNKDIVSFSFIRGAYGHTDSAYPNKHYDSYCYFPHNISDAIFNVTINTGGSEDAISTVTLTALKAKHIKLEGKYVVPAYSGNARGYYSILHNSNNIVARTQSSNTEIVGYIDTEIDLNIGDVITINWESYYKGWQGILAIS